MIRRILLAAALVAAAGRWAQAATCGPPTGLGPVLNGFEGTDTDPTCTGAGGESGDLSNWVMTYSGPAGTLTASSGFPVVEGNFIGYEAWTPTTNNATFTLSSAFFSSANAWNSDNYVLVAYASESTTTAGNYAFQYNFTNGAGALGSFLQAGTASGGLVSRASYTSASQWTYVVTSLNYVRNLGYDTTSISKLAMVNFSTVAGEGPVGVAYDDLQLDPISGTLDTPNAAVPPAQIGGSGSCSGGTSFTLTWTAQTQSGTDAISGYHIYRSTGPTGPWVSVAYVAFPGTSFHDTSPGLGSSEYYVVLPYASTSTAFGGGATAYFTSNSNSLDPAASKSIGVNEAALVPADAAGPFDPPAACTPTDTPSDSPTYTATPTITPSDTTTDTSTATPTATRTDTSTDTPTVTPSVSASDTPSNTASQTYTLTSTDTQTATPTGTVTATPSASPTFTLSSTFTETFTDTPSLTLTSSFTATPSHTVSPTFSASPTGTETYTISPTFSPSPVYSASPTNTPGVAPGSGVGVWPNPVYPDRGEVLHLGNLQPGQAWAIFNMIGRPVWKGTAQGNPLVDTWNAFNENGAEVTTGVYLLLAGGKIYRIAVVRN